MVAVVDLSRKEALRKKVKVHRKPHHGGLEAGCGRSGGPGVLPHPHRSKWISFGGASTFTFSATRMGMAKA
jgi:hypothetical protein